MARTPWRLPNAVIYLQAVFRPSLLRPNIYAPGLTDVSWRRLRDAGYNAVVIDKDNCLTWPNRDELQEDAEVGWNDLKAAFGAANVLVVSNSAGTKKDPGGIAAESVSRRLGVPVLIRRQSKPGCASQIVDYFAGKSEIRRVSRPAIETSLQGEEIIQEAEKAWKETESESTHPAQERKTTPREDLRLVVVGDRLATDVLLARRLAKHVQAIQTGEVSAYNLPNALSIVTTRLFKRNDVVPLRWLESAWSRIGLRKGAHGTLGSENEWSRFLTAHAEASSISATPTKSRSRRIFALLRSGVLAVPTGWRAVQRGFVYVRKHPPRIPTRDELRRGALTTLYWLGRTSRAILLSAWRWFRIGSVRAGKLALETVRSVRARRVATRS